jgi:hypothetical protein
VGYVFTISGKSPVGGWSMIKNRLDAAMGTPAPWRLHDLRRTFVTGPADLGIRPRCDRDGGQPRQWTARRRRWRLQQKRAAARERRAALERWAAHVEGLVAGKATKVVLHMVQK